jgi:hypothetical protein
LNALRTRPSSLSDIFARLSQGWGRTAGHRLRVLSLIAAGETSIDTALMEIRAQGLIRYQADEMFHAQIDTVRDGSECGLARNVVRADESGGLEFVHPATGSEWCKKTDTICRQDDDLGSKEQRLRAAGHALQASAAHRPFGDAAVLAADKPTERKGKQCFAKLGDVSIALECDPAEVILTTDSSFEVMATSLGFTVERFKPTAPP